MSYDESQVGLQNRTGPTVDSGERDSVCDLCQPQARLLYCVQVRPRAFSLGISIASCPPEVYALPAAPLPALTPANLWKITRALKADTRASA